MVKCNQSKKHKTCKACDHAKPHNKNCDTLGKEPCTCEGNCYLAADPNAENRVMRCKCVEV